MGIWWSDQRSDCILNLSFVRSLISGLPFAFRFIWLGIVLLAGLISNDLGTNLQFGSFFGRYPPLTAWVRVVGRWRRGWRWMRRRRSRRWWWLPRNSCWFYFWSYRGFKLSHTGCNALFLLSLFISQELIAQILADPQTRPNWNSTSFFDWF